MAGALAANGKGEGNHFGAWFRSCIHCFFLYLNAQNLDISSHLVEPDTEVSEMKDSLADPDMMGDSYK